MNTVPLIILFLGGIILTAGDVVFKSWVEKGLGYGLLYGVGILLYLVGSMMLVESYKHNINIVSAGIIQVLFNTIILLIFSYLYFHEPLTSVQMVGVVLGVSAIYFLL